MKCWKCKSEDHNPSRRNKVEKAVSFVLPVRPYRCGSCEFRFYGPISPLFNRSRAISVGVLGFVLLLFIANAVVVSMSEDPEDPVGETEQAQGVEDDGVDPDLEDIRANAPAFPPEGAGGSEDPAAESVALTEPEVEEDLSQHSDFVKAQLARNRAIEAGEQPPPMPEKNAAATPPPRKSQATPTRSTTAATPSSSGRINAIIPHGETDIFRLEIETNGPVSIKNNWLDKTAPKLVVNLQGNWSLKRGLKQSVSVQDGLVKKIRMGSHPNYFSIVLDLNTAEVDKPQFVSGDKSLIVKLSRR